MIDRSDRPPELPNGFCQTARKLRAVRHPIGFEKRLAQALEAAEAEEAARAELRAAGRPQSSKRWGMWLMVCPSVAVIGVIAAVLWQAFEVRTDPHEGGLTALEAGAGSFFDRFEERAVASAPSGESAWVDLDLWTHYHGDKDATLELNMPHAVQVKTNEHSTLHAAAPQCGAERCTHSFTMRAALRGSVMPVRIGMDSPGQYDIHIKHASPGVHVRELFLVSVEP